DFVCGDDNGSETEKGIDAFCAREISRVLAKHVERGEIERSSKAVDYRSRLLRGNEAAASSDDDRQFAFGVQIVRDLRRRQNDIAVRLEHTSRRFHEASRLFRLDGIDVFRMRFVIQTDAPDFGWDGVRQAGLDFGERQRAHAGGWNFANIVLNNLEHAVWKPEIVL